MKKILGICLVLVLLLCSCNEQELHSSQIGNLDSVIAGNSSLNESVEETVFVRYKAKENYSSISLGASMLYQNEKYYYYSDEFGFFAIDKRTKEQSVLSEKLLLSMCVFEDKIYFPENGGVVVFDTNTHKFEEKSYKELLSLEISVPQIRYNLSILMIKDGWLISVVDNERDTEEVYLADYNFTTKTLLPISSFDFVLDDDIFILDKSGNVFCYNYNTKKDSYVTTGFNISSDEYEFLASRNFTYLGKDRILVYAEDKLHVVSLKDGKICLEIPFEAEDPTSIRAEAVYDDENIYLLLEQAQDSYALFSISYLDNKSETIRQAEIKSPFTSCFLADIDAQHLYLYHLGYYDDEGNPLSYYSCINKDGTGEETIFKSKIPCVRVNKHIETERHIGRSLLSFNNILYKKVLRKQNPHYLLPITFYFLPQNTAHSFRYGRCFHFTLGYLSFWSVSPSK